VVSTNTAGVPTSTTRAPRGVARVARGRWSAGLARVYRVHWLMPDRHRDLVQRRLSGAWPPKPSIQSVTYLMKHE